MISTHSQTLHYSIINHLMKHNYDIEVTSDFDNETTSHDGFIFSSSPNVSKIVKNWKPLGRLEIINSNNKEIFDYVKLTKERFNL